MKAKRKASRRWHDEIDSSAKREIEKGSVDLNAFFLLGRRTKLKRSAKEKSSSLAHENRPSSRETLLAKESSMPTQSSNRR